MAAVADLLAHDVDVVITHGNGPQVGNLLVKNELAASVVPPVPLDWCGAQTQATLGFVLLNALDAALAGARRRPAYADRRHPHAASPPTTPASPSPTKPIGRYLPAEEAQVLVEHGETWEDRGEKGWRRVVASPEPLEIIDAPAVHALVEAGFVVVANGGGGIPVVRDDRRRRCTASRPSSTRTSAPRCWRAPSAPTCSSSPPTCPRGAALRHPRGRAARAGHGRASCAATPREGHFASGSMGPEGRRGLPVRGARRHAGPSSPASTTSSTPSPATAGPSTGPRGAGASSRTPWGNSIELFQPR